MATSATNYTSLITSQHNDKPNYMGVIGILVQPGVDKQNVMGSLPGLLDLDAAVGDQLDKLGQWIGASRNLKQPLPPSGITTLGDSDYRLLLQAIVALNNWDGTVPGMYDIWSVVFSGSTFDILIQDNQDMTMFVVILASTFSTVAMALLTNGYFDLRPAGVRMKGYYQPSVPGQPVFGWGVQNDNIAGWGTGVWVQPIVVE